MARANSVCFQAGAKTVPMESSDLRIARVTTDPTVQTKGENDAFTDSGPSFDSILLVAYTIGCYATFSREVIEDAPNCPQLIETVFSRALGKKLDYYLLRGSGSQELLGILGSSGINTSSVGTLSWDDIQTAIKLVEIDNQNPTSYVISPTTKMALLTLKQGDGTNSPLAYQEPPEDAKLLQRFVTTSMTDTDAVISDMSKMLVGVRQNILVESTDSGDDAFSKHQIGIKATMRVAMALEDPEAFCSLTDI